MTNREMLLIAMRQSAIDNNCAAEDFTSGENKVVLSVASAQARRYLALPFYCNLVSYGDNVVASVNAEIAQVVEEYIDKYPVEHCFETPNMQVLNEALKEKGMCVCFMAEYFLPDIRAMKLLLCVYETRVLRAEDFAQYYLPEWGNALNESRKHLDRLAVGAFDDGKWIGLAGASADCDTMWQIGVDVLADYRKKGIAVALVSELASEILQRGIVPFYCCAWSNLRSARTAIKSGFRPAWVELTAKSMEFVAQIN